ncbi:deoxyribose-phosphate aldolase [Mycolicibacterium monacense]|uniref:deoxyribose-phosphate aldolase n=1 Tax=Mycolicibacterium monacense TaxID=85693 RepID=UPI0007EC1BAE|nr:deoxyribose-phosphate aldolase [Mycolicibacterium monacense]OBF48612.1 deoxyribose-phosphate aldolase [Mycolicibacterium monacense]
MGGWTRERVAGLVDHTLLKPEAGEGDVEALVADAEALGVYAACVSPSMVPAAVRMRPFSTKIAAVVGFPSGKHLPAVKAHEAALAGAAGADEIDMVIDVGAALAGDIDAVRADIAAVRAAIGERTLLKVIVESAALLELGGRDVLVDTCLAAKAVGAEYVKTSTGFHPLGGASAGAVEIMVAAVGPQVEVKASGGIRTAADAIAMLDAGATRLGLSATRAVLDDLD